MVMSVYYQSEAYRNGIRLGDTILSINGKIVKDLTEQKFCNELQEKGKQIKVTVLRAGKTTEISFQLKYLL